MTADRHFGDTDPAGYHEAPGSGEERMWARVWCGECETARDIVETHDEVLQEYHGQRGVIVTRLSCGHQQYRADGTFYPLAGG